MITSAMAARGPTAPDACAWTFALLLATGKRSVCVRPAPVFVDH